MRKTLYYKFILAYLLFALFGFISVATIVSGMVSSYVKHNEADHLYKEATEIANTYAADLYSSETSLDTVYRQLTILSGYTDSEIWILNPSGRMVAKSGEKINPDKQVVVSGFNPSELTGSLYTEGTFWGYFQETRLSVLAPITSNYKINGYVVIHIKEAQLESDANHILNIAYIMLIILLVLSLIILFFFTEVVYVPLRKITTATEQYAAGNMNYKFTVDSEDEMGYLAASLQYMASEIARSEDDQKKFIANVSHDFRSPLTSIRGFLEAMLDGTIPPELHDKYIRVVLNETERLTKLTNGLLTLNNLNTDGMLLARTDFDINETIRQVALSFEQTCRTKKIGIELVLTGDRLYVNADKDKIQQVLYNLVDNAIKFSHPDSSVKIETTDRHNKIFVSVKDTGIGIPKEDQKMIFERFYKTDLSRGKDKKGTGLGLSIVREILRAHGENINVISTEGVGSEFIFTLKRSKLNDQLED
ncbi:MAG: HAMP domain-containing sensor histidine kinase [Lachnospiraceae bacterium]|nr:HAMP domain-containing sensor histidine kinase [Lachnospiraceae bacterium]